jgi:hypothetical protein
MSALTPGERALFQEAIPLWKAWRDQGLSLSGSLLPFQFGFDAGVNWANRNPERAASLASSTAATKVVINYNVGDK